MSDSELNRRKFVAATGTAGALVLAGCADSGPGGGNNSSENGEETDDTGAGNETGDTGSEDETYALTVTVEDDQAEPVEGATVTLEQAGSGMLGGNGGENESNNESDGLGDLGEGNDSDNESENESETGSFIQEDNESNESDDGMLGGNGEENESGNESGNESEDGGLGASEDEWPREEETDENGEVEFDELEDGEYTVTAENEGEEAEDDVEIDGGDEEVTLTLGEDGGMGNETEGNDSNDSNDSDNESDDGLGL